MVQRSAWNILSFLFEKKKDMFRLPKDAKNCDSEIIE